MRLSVFTRLLSTALVATTFTAVVAAPASADLSDAVPGVVADEPISGTPKLTYSGENGMVRAVEEQDGYVAAGGLFDAAKKPGGSEFAVSNFTVWVKDSNIILDAPSFDGEVHAIEPAADGRSWYVGGSFKLVDGNSRRALVQVDRDGTVSELFAPVLKWAVKDLELVGDTLYVGGNVVEVNGVAQTGIVALDALTGASRPWAPLFEGAYSTPGTNGSTSVDKLDASSDGTRLVVAGNFVSIDGQETGRVAQFDIASPVPQLLDWSVAGFRIDQCPIWKTAAFVTDIDVAPSGDWVAVSTTGGWGNPNGDQYLCDGLSRFELDVRGDDVRPTWISHTGGDSLTSVQIAGEVVYAGGHQRWMNNSYRRNRAGVGSVERAGISAHDARNGVPIPWNPTRNPRGHGAYEATITETGLWVGQDTGKIGDKFRGFAAFMPLVGGEASLGWSGNGTLPVDVVQLRGGDDDLTRFTGSAGSTLGRLDTTIDESATGITSIGDDVLVATGDGTFELVAARGTGTVTEVDLRGLATAYLDPSRIRGLAYDEERGELLYTLLNSDVLFARGYEADGQLVEAQARAVATSDHIDWRDTRSMFLVDGVLYVGRADKSLVAVPYGHDGPLDATPPVVSGPGVDGLTWDRPSAVRTSASTARRNVAPTADFTMSCEGLSCRVDAGPSTDRFGGIVSYAFTASGSAGSANLDAAHGVLTLQQSGSVTMTLQVTDAEGATDTRVRSTSVTAPPLALGGQSTDNTTTATHAVSVPAGTSDGSIALLSIAVNRSGVLPTLPIGLDGWTSLGTRATGNTESAVWWTTVGAADIGTEVQVPLSRSSKGSTSLTTWSGVDLAAPIAAVASGSGSGTTAAHVSATTTTTTTSTVLELWTMKNPDVSDWTAPSGTSTVLQSHGSGGGHISTLLTSRDGVGAGTVGGSTATADATDAGVTTWTIALRPA